MEEGDVSEHKIFIEKGCVRAYFDKDGEDKTVQFFSENAGFSSFHSFVNELPSEFTIETIEPSVIYLLPKQYVHQMIGDLSHEPDFMKIVLYISASLQKHYTNELIFFIRDAAEQPYQPLLVERSHVIQRVPQHYMGSYLGVSAVLLSRIKSKLAREKDISEFK